MKRSIRLSALALVVLVAPAAPAQDPPQRDLTVAIRQVGVTQDVVDRAKQGLLTSRSAQSLGSNRRIISFRLLDPDRKDQPSYADRYQAVLYDYSSDQGYSAEGTLYGKGEPKLDVLTTPPDSTPEEFEMAKTVLLRDAKIGSLLARGAYQAYAPMPPLVPASKAKGSNGRTVIVGLLPHSSDLHHMMVGVNLVKGTVVDLGSDALSVPPTPDAVCGPPNAGQGTTARGTAGEYEVVVSQGPTEIWRFTVVRPSASSGTRASGVELKNVDYKLHRVLGRAHAPILNVRYINNACGPYRDWQYQEGQFDATGTDVAAGVRLCTAAPATLLDDGTDSGAFRGVAVYNDGQVITVVSEMEAGWYRYVTKWRFDLDGTIHPDFGFAGVSNSCICNAHQHHVYWRFDFDIDGAASNEIYEKRMGRWTKMLTETSGRRDRQGSLTWLIQNTQTRRNYQMISGPGDGTADDYGVKDVYFLKAKGTAEFDDGINCTSGCNTTIQMDNFVNGDSIAGTDVVVWYGAHYLHDEQNAREGDFHRVGPTLVPGEW